MNLNIRGIGLWGPGLYGWSDFEAGRDSEFKSVSGPLTPPSPKSIPARERRRAPLPVKLAVETLEQACEMAEIDPATVATVFSSAMGDNDITDYICRTLIGPERLLSPTKFHNSVHNAASGYWSIAARNRSPGGYVGGFEDSFAIALLETATLCATENRPVAMAIYDVVTVPPLHDICRTDEPFGAALILDSGSDPDKGPGGWPIEICCREGRAERPQPRSPSLRNLCEKNPAAQCLALFEAIASEKSFSLRWPVGGATHLEVRLRD